ncbi:adrenocortical dysplasia protein homolog isoform X1 [Electrophorus electricus]|uniref:adrenocortical dysplasia protein homolog isoform X1 n=1 Tax=Electrophorus electricus TaxID=8005 RepID=UPI0015D06545|nr:adrenocortical dysplasia protein homolog isoform X1 [Electrophorus electricus]
MRRSRRTETEMEPWIEQLIHNYDKYQPEISFRAHVVGVGDVAAAQCTDEPDACMLFLSDGAVFIPAVLSAAAWERMQELEERETFSGLNNTTVSVRKFQLNFHMDPELTSCQFYLRMSQVITVGKVTRHYHPPSCTTLHSVKQKILQTWRSLRKQCSLNSMSSQSGFPLSCLMGAWHSDIIMDLLNDAIKRITPSTVCHSNVATPTYWHRERLRCRGEEYFSTPVSHLLIPEEQKELLTADLGKSSGSETPSGLLPPHTDVMKCQPIIAQEQERHSPTMAFDRPTDGDRPTLHHMGPGFCCSGGVSGEMVNPWDMFSPAPDLLGTPSSCSEISIEPLSQHGSQSLMITEPQVPMATSTQAQCSNPSTGETSGSSVTPYQKPHPPLHSLTCLSDETSTDTPEEGQVKQQVLSPPTWTGHSTVLSTQENTPGGPIHNKTPPVSPPTKTGQVHSDGSGFSYTYEPSPEVVSALTHFKVPEELVQWAMAYLGVPGRMCMDHSGGTEHRDRALLPHTITNGKH